MKSKPKLSDVNEVGGDRHYIGEKQVLDYLKQRLGDSVTVARIASELNISPTQTKDRLRSLVKKGYVKREQGVVAGHWTPIYIARKRRVSPSEHVRSRRRSLN